MGGLREVASEDLRQAAGTLSEVAGTLNSAWTSFSTQTKAKGDIFGDDAVGGLIGVSFYAAEQIVDQMILSSGQALADFASGLTQMAQAHEQTETAVHLLFKKLGG